ncbi:MAG: squalene/phytoene synthase family protein [Hyphomicrobiales bacterium]|nr:squalene/phytoene synthase family protein [Hyphomicrobiales bacterium]
MGQQADKVGTPSAVDFMAEAVPVEDTDHIRDLVRSSDQDRYWSALFAPEPARQSLLALYAFAIELSRIPDRVSEPQLGRIRLQWWRDALAPAVTSGEGNHPVLAAMAEVVRRHTLPLSELDAMIEAHEFGLSDEPMQDRAKLRSYLDATTGAQLRLASAILGGRPGEHERLIAAAAAAYGLSALMRALPHDAAHGRIFLPGDLLAAHGLHPNVILSGTDNADLRAALRDLRADTVQAFEQMRPLFAKLPRALRPAFLPLSPVPAYIQALASPELNPIRQMAQLNPLRRYALIWRSYLTGHI